MLGVDVSLPFDLAIDLFGVVDVLAAACVTVHVLLRKRDVRAAIGWIGLAWLSPITGSVLYYLFGINRVTRRAARLAPRTTRGGSVGAPVGEPPLHAVLPQNILALAHVGGRLTGRPLTGHNTIALLRNGDEAYPAMLTGIHAATRSVALASYIFRADNVGAAFIGALSEASGRGVEIRVLVDGIGGGYFASSAIRQLRRGGIAAERFMHDWLPWRMPFLNMRNHKKLLIIDGTTAFIGGLNLGGENLHRSYPAHPVSDVHFHVAGPIVSQLMGSFADDWNFTTSERLDGDCWWPHIPPSGTVLARGIDSGPDEDIGNIETVLAGAVASATRKLRIVTPYFLPDQQLMSGIVLAALRGIQVEIVLPERSNHRLMDWAMRSQFALFGVPDVHVYVTAVPFDHAKLVTVDGLWCAVGSANWDVRSLRLNFELMLECYDHEITEMIDQLIDAKIASANRLSLQDLAARFLPTKLRDAASRLLLPYL